MTDKLKWLATGTLIIGTLINGFGFYPAGPIVLFIGGLMWLTVSVQWREPSLIVTNLAMSIAGAIGLIYYWFTL